ncbi:MAG: DUF5371 family protein [Candidatus Methanoperedens sp.]|nr:DUF5371 family protein [Candidatus Methanoperedens sp.]
MMTKIVHVQSVLPYEDTIALKAKTGETSIKEAISTAIYHFLKCHDSDGERGNNTEKQSPFFYKNGYRRSA